MKHKQSWSKKLVLVAMAVLLLGSCATLRKDSVTDTEQSLAAAGFHQRAADTSERLAHLQSLPPQKLFSKTRDGELYYLYADQEFCNCLYVGDEAAYDRYQNLSIEKQIVGEEEAAAMDWDMWGPHPWW